jgi:hypothetical protein
MRNYKRVAYVTEKKERKQNAWIKIQMQYSKLYHIWGSVFYGNEQRPYH